MFVKIHFMLHLNCLKFVFNFVLFIILDLLIIWVKSYQELSNMLDVVSTYRCTNTAATNCVHEKFQNLLPHVRTGMAGIQLTT